MRKNLPVNAPTYEAACTAVADLLRREGRPWRVLSGVQVVDGTRRSIAPAAITSPDSAVVLTVTRPAGEQRTFYVTIEREPLSAELRAADAVYVHSARDCAGRSSRVP